jgi:hypothetical protein
MKVRRLKSLGCLATAVAVSVLVLGGAVRSTSADDRTAAVTCNPFMCGDNQNQVLL